MAATDESHRPVARKSVRDDAETASGAYRDRSGRETTDAASDGSSDLRGRVVDAYSAAGDKASEAYGIAREKALDARERVADAVDDNPIAVVLGGVAIGIAIGALLPRTRREADIYGAIGTRLADAARAAGQAARETGRERLGDMGLSVDNAGASLRSVLDAAIAAATDARPPAPNPTDA